MRQRWGTNQRKRASCRGAQATAVCTNTVSCLDLVLVVHSQRGFAARVIAGSSLSTTAIAASWSLSPKNQLDTTGSQVITHFGGTRSAPPQSPLTIRIISVTSRKYAHVHGHAHASQPAPRMELRVIRLIYITPGWSSKVGPGFRIPLRIRSRKSVLKSQR